VVTAVVSAWGQLSRRDHLVVPLPDRCSAAARIKASPLPGIAHGNGRSYGDESLNAGGTVWMTGGLDKFIAFDAARGILRCEAGVTLEQVIAVALPKGWFLPVTPGTQFVTVGGAIANDVHGKNHHHRGTFGEHVSALRLQRTDGTVIDCGPSENDKWFHATVGGMGLTGTILEASLQLRKVDGPWIETHIEPFETLAEFFALSTRFEAAWEYSVSWIDCLHGKNGDVRGIFFCGNHGPSTAATPERKPRSAATLPALPWVNTASSKLFNALYFRRNKARAGAAHQPYGTFFYPLDSVLSWNRIYGRAGFYQYQCVMPTASQVDGIRELLRLIRLSDTGSFLSVLKTFGHRPPAGMLSFPMAGTTLALDFPNRGAATLRLFDQLNAVVAAAGGRLYAAKDASMPRWMFEQGYPLLPQFERYRDPGISSEMSRRLFGY
jgi:FAD/FMN-containing dehydrogenase